MTSSMPYPDDLEECIHGMVGPCSSCMAPERRKQEQRAQEWDRFTGRVKAMFDGWCGVCGGRIIAGDFIEYDREGKWIHAECK